MSDTGEQISQQRPWHPAAGIVTQLGANGAGDQSSSLSILDQRPSSSADLPNCDNRKTIDDLPPTSDDQTLNVSTTHVRPEPRLRRCNRKEAVTFDELISTLEESQLLYLEIMFEYEDEDIVVGGSSELDHIQQHRLKLIDAIGRCRSLKRLDVFGRWHIEEVRVLCQNLLLHPALEELCLFNSFIDEREGATLSQMLLEQNHNILKRCSISGRGRVSAVGTTASKPGLAFGGCRDITFDELISAELPGYATFRLRRRRLPLGGCIQGSPNGASASID